MTDSTYSTCCWRGCLCRQSQHVKEPILICFRFDHVPHYTTSEPSTQLYMNRYSPNFLLPQEQFDFVKKGLKRLKIKTLQEYYSTDTWARARELRRTSIVEKCETCGSLELPGECTFHLHHKTYERLGRERGEDLVWLCPECHELLHLMLTISNDMGGLMFLAMEYVRENKKAENLSIELFQSTHTESD